MFPVLVICIDFYSSNELTWRCFIGNYSSWWSCIRVYYNWSSLLNLWCFHVNPSKLKKGWKKNLGVDATYCSTSPFNILPSFPVPLICDEFKLYLNKRCLTAGDSSTLALLANSLRKESKFQGTTRERSEVLNAFVNLQLIDDTWSKHTWKVNPTVLCFRQRKLGRDYSQVRTFFFTNKTTAQISFCLLVVL